MVLFIWGAINQIGWSNLIDGDKMQMSTEVYSSYWFITPKSHFPKSYTDKT